MSLFIARLFSHASFQSIVEKAVKALTDAGYEINHLNDIGEIHLHDTPK